MKRSTVDTIWAVLTVIVILLGYSVAAHSEEIDPKSMLLKPAIEAPKQAQEELNLFGDKSTWDKADTALQTLNGALFVVDTLQTLSIRKNSGYEETNPILGKNPSDFKVISYFIGTFVAHTAIAYYVPDMIFSDPVKAPVQMLVKTSELALKLLL